MIRRVGTMVAMLTLLGWLTDQATATADENKKEQKQIQVRAIAVGGANLDIEKVLKESGLEGEQLEKAKAAVEKALKSVHPHRKLLKAAEGVMRLHLTPEVTAAGADEKTQRIELKVVLSKALEHSGGASDRQLTVHWVEDTPRGVREALKKAAEKLKELGLNDEQLKKSHAAVEKAMKNHHREMVIAVEAAHGGLLGHKFMIGVECAEVDEALRNKSGVKEGIGIAVNSVFDDSPAEKAGIQKNDILIKIGDEELKNARQLIEAVQKAGQEKEKMSVTLLRGKHEKTVVVEPAERKALGLSLPEISGMHEGLGKLLLELPQKRMLMIGPGMVTDASPSPEAKAQAGEIKKLQEQVEDLAKQVKQMQAALKKMQSNDD